jgi:hypothetical protein
MGRRDRYEPPYPQSQAELEAYCTRFITALRASLDRRLVCVLLSGSWARGEAQPPRSDADLTVIVDFCDDAALEALRRAWRESGMGCANVYGADEVPVMSRVAAHMYTTSAIVLFGHNPFTAPTRQDLVEDLAISAESLARNARCLDLYPWLTAEERTDLLQYTLGKNELKRALENLVAFRTGVYPHNQEDLRAKLRGSAEGIFWNWLATLNETERAEQANTIARRLSHFARDWFREIAPYRQPQPDLLGASLCAAKPRPQSL